MEYMHTNICFIVLCVVIFFQSNILTFICRRKEKVWKHGFVNLKGIGVKFLKRILVKGEQGESKEGEEKGKEEMEKTVEEEGKKPEEKCL